MSTPSTGSVEGPKSRAVTAVFASVRLDVLDLQVPFFNPPHLSPVIRISSIGILLL